MNLRLGIVHDLLKVGLLAASLLIGLDANLPRKAPLASNLSVTRTKLFCSLAELVAAPPIPISNSDAMTFDQFRDVFNSKSAVILDAREQAFYDRGYIPGAFSLPRDTFAKSYETLRSTLNKNRERLIVVCCSGGDCHDSRLVAGALLSLGYPQVKVFVVGWTGWTENDIPVAR